MTKLKRSMLFGVLLCGVLALNGCGEKGSVEPSKDPAGTVETESSTLNKESASETSELGSVPAQSGSESQASSSGSESMTPAVETPATTPAVDKSYLNNIAALPNKSGGCGFSAANGRDEKNVPNDMYWYVKNYSKYNADFIQDTNKNIIYLTMDEGYEAGYTPAILDTLKEKNVKAVFFLTKQFIDSDPELIQRMIDEGHVIGNHTVSHKNMPTLSLDQQKQEITAINDRIKDQFGYDVKLFRFPEGEFSEQSLALVESLGMRSVFWSFSHKDFNTDAQPDPAASLQKCLDEVHPGAIYLLHAVSATNTEILGDFIDGVRAKGFEFGVYPVQ